ncbi:hypothetical protein HOD05_00260 [Candidatus Woesearchaeota archaeon]|jgi:hypothetical protein|nr:hypothetical protein [Candidatus Woesearchaeota archaeon]MBT4150843.1 hypothetical protein [Candidatus Woesearchaeota archaeon]MBT4246948.1 hypothetical protein [Candidatus Woesearchaeota archaeon]MBT4433633.1 hypothetical protein [Candidatus Woesearchaeota archaeon]MBT7332593.1 hypothetical protein [Candidatus Woesearchaeota archaeon]
MGALNKLMFWKKDDDFDFDSALNKEMTPSDIPPMDNLGLDSQPTGLEEKSPFDHPAQPTATRPFQQQAASPYAAPQQPQQAFPSPGQPLQRPGFQQPPPQNNDLISSKLDTIKAQLSSIEQRLVNLERAAGVQQQKKLW